MLLIIWDELFHRWYTQRIWSGWINLLGDVTCVIYSIHRLVNWSVAWANQPYSGGAILKSVSATGCLHPKVSINVPIKEYKEIALKLIHICIPYNVGVLWNIEKHCTCIIVIQTRWADEVLGNNYKNSIMIYPFSGCNGGLFVYSLREPHILHWFTLKHPIYICLHFRYDNILENARIPAS